MRLTYRATVGYSQSGREESSESVGSAITMNELRVYSVLLGIAALALSALPAKSATVADPNFPEHYFLLYSDIVVRGLVVSADEEYVPLAEFSPDLGPSYPGLSMEIARITIRITHVLKGAHDGSEIDVFVIDDSSRPNDSESDQEVIVGLDLRSDIRGGTYVLQSRRGYYVQRGSDWISNGSAYSELDIYAAIDATKTFQIARSSDAVVEGTVESVREYESWTDQRLAVVQEVSLRIENVIAGVDIRGAVVVRSITRGNYWPVWRQPVPKGTRAGDRWYAFLRDAGDGYHIAGGVNGCFKIVGDQLIYNNDVVLPSSRKQMDSMVQSAIESKE